MYPEDGHKSGQNIQEAYYVHNIRYSYTYAFVGLLPYVMSLMHVKGLFEIGTLFHGMTFLFHVTLAFIFMSLRSFLDLYTNTVL
jgi:hypothetical protein